MAADPGGLLHFQPAPFFADKNRAFWRLNMLGWGGYALQRAVSAIANDQPWQFLVVLLIVTITGFSISLILSVIYGWLIKQRALLTWSATVVILIAAVSLYALTDAWVLQLYRADEEISLAQRFVGIFSYDFIVLGAWSALYYAINYFLQVEQQADRLERLEAQATSAQLAMLRYQLNPHFLFNTLNSISTLVLLKQTRPANAMLTKLSSFLRHTLVSDPGGTVTVAQEVETLQLYLEIERMRFEERLQTDFRIDPPADKGQIPSMLLQP
ncbi:MAG: histidine kinase, partial [Croceibacterium sp.]